MFSGALLNPRLPAEVREKLKQLCELFPLPEHTWIASSGSSAPGVDSVKLIALSHRALQASAQAVNRHLQATNQDVWFQSLPEFHVGGLGVRIRAELSGSHRFLFDSEKWNPQTFAQQAEQRGATLGALVPTQIFDLVMAKVKAPPSFRAIVVGGANLGEDLYLNARALGWPLLPSFGMTECCSQIATASLAGLDRGDRSLEILSHIQARTTSEGFLEISSPSLLTGYAQWVSGVPRWFSPTQEGWYRTEDKVEIQGSKLKFSGRDSDFIKISGEGVSLLGLQTILEEALGSMNIQSLKNFAICPIPDSRVGFQIYLAVAGEMPNSAIDDIIKKFNQHVLPYERIFGFKKIPLIPRSALGKVIKAQLLEMMKDADIRSL